jgi:hypothetical protein
VNPGLWFISRDFNFYFLGLLMNTKHVLAIAALLITSQAFALTAIQKQQGCDGDIGNCSSGLGPAGGGSGEAATYNTAYIILGSLWESFEDSQGEFEIETNLTTGKKTVHFGGKAAFLIKPAPPTTQMKRSQLAYGALASAQTLAEAKKKAEQEKAQAAAAQASGAAAAAAQKAQAEAAAAKKAAEAKALAEAVQKAGGVGAYSAGLAGPVSTQPAGSGVISGAPILVAQPVAGISNGPITARKKP